MMSQEMKTIEMSLCRMLKNIALAHLSPPHFPLCLFQSREEEDLEANRWLEGDAPCQIIA